MKNSNPFSAGLNSKSIYFCNREKEIKLILKRVKKKKNVAVISNDGIGKTALVKLALARLEKDKNYKTLINLQISPTKQNHSELPGFVKEWYSRGINFCFMFEGQG